MTEERCGTCRFAGMRVNYNEHKCRRRAPITEKVESWQDTRGWVPVFPIVRSDDWCGDYEAAQLQAAPAQAERIADLEQIALQREASLHEVMQQNMAYRKATQALLDTMSPRGGNQRAVLAELVPMAGKEGECVPLPADLVMYLLMAHFRAHDAAGASMKG